jgi:hypothetical protein
MYFLEKTELKLLNIISSYSDKIGKGFDYLQIFFGIKKYHIQKGFIQVCRLGENQHTFQLFLFFLTNYSDEINKEDGFCTAIEENNFQIMDYLVNEQVNIHCKCDYAIRMACFQGNLDMVKYLIERGANIHSMDNYCIHWAFANGHFPVYDFLIEKGMVINEKGINWLIEKCILFYNIEGIKKLIKFTNANHFNQLIEQMICKNEEGQSFQIADMILEKLEYKEKYDEINFQNLLLVCLREDNIEITNYLIDNSAPISSEYVLKVIRRGSVPFLKNLQDRLFILHEMTSYDITQNALFASNSYGLNNFEMLDYILENGGNLQLVNPFNPKHYTKEICNYLLNQGLTIDFDSLHTDLDY